MDMTLFNTAAASFTQAHQIIKTLLNLKIDQAVLVQILPLQSLLADAQAAQLALLDEKATLVAHKHDLEQKIMCIEAWAEESKRYKLHEIETGILAHALKESKADGEPPHWLCPTCYNKSQKSLLIIDMPGGAIYHGYKCPNCPTKLPIDRKIKPEYIKDKE